MSNDWLVCHLESAEATMLADWMIVLLHLERSSVFTSVHLGLCSVQVFAFG